MPSGHRLDGTAQDVPESLQVFLTLAEEKGKDYVSFFTPKENQTLGKLAKETARDSLVSLSNSLLIVSLSIVQIAFTNFLNTVSTVVSNCCFSDQLFVKTTTTTRQPSMLFGAEIKLHPSLL